MKHSIPLLLTLLLTACASNPEAPPARALAPPGVATEVKTIAVGSSDYLEFDFNPGSPRVANKGVIEVMPSKKEREWIVTPLRKGVSALDVVDDAGSVRRHIVYNCITTDLSAKTMEIRALLRNTSGLIVNSIGDRIVVDGRITDDHVAARLLKLQRAYPEMMILAEGDGEACSLCTMCTRKTKKK